MLLFGAGLLVGFALGVFVAYPRNTIVRDPKACHKSRVERERVLLKKLEERDKRISELIRTDE